jgi:hypothetical protein
MTWECLPIYAYDDIRHMLLFSSPPCGGRETGPGNCPELLGPANKVLNAGGTKAIATFLFFHCLPLPHDSLLFFPQKNKIKK